jgi:GAF domain-containing protein
MNMEVSGNESPGYEEMSVMLGGLIGDERNFIANASNFAALLYQFLGKINWVGFYMKDGNELILGPFSGKPACLRIEFGKGVCGTSALKRETLIVPDVHEFPGHIACDAASCSEIVIPLIHIGELFGVLDIDSPIFERFNESDGVGLQGLIDILLDRSDIKSLKNYYRI